jgi:hypothetical protein
MVTLMRFCLFAFLFAMSAQAQLEAPKRSLVFQNLRESGNLTFESGLKLWNNGTDANLADLSDVYLGVSIHKFTPTHPSASLLKIVEDGAQRIPTEGSFAHGLNEFFFDDEPTYQKYLGHIDEITSCNHVRQANPLIVDLRSGACPKLDGALSTSIAYRTNGIYLVGLFRAEDSGELLLRSGEANSVKAGDVIAVHVYVLPITN